MAGLSEQEEDLETQIEAYKAQLRIVQGKVSASSEAELAPLIADLQQLIQLSEENLLELKKQKLLLMLHKTSPPDDDHSSPNNKVKASAETAEAAVSCATQEDGIVGMKCRAPLKESWGGESYHNAIILSVEATPPSSDDQPLPGDPQVRLLFTQPLYPAMRPCPFFLQATCKFSEEECKFSHGHTAPLSTLQSHLQPDHSMAHVGGQCLAQHEDGLWHRAIISSVGEEEYVVHFPSLGATCTVSCEGVMPLESDSSTSSSSGSDGEEGGGMEGEDEEVVVEWRPSAMKCALGEWERHTTGIGSKLLAKMGYIVGHGLGKEGQGRVEPVEIVILPSGKSLDVCAELREAKKVKVVDGIEKVKKRKRKKKKKVPLVDEDKKPMDMFEFLNTQIFPSDTSKKKMLELKKDSSNSPAANSKNLNVKLLKTQEEMKAVQRRKKSLQESLQRHQKRKEKQLVEQVKEKIRGVDSQLEDLHRQESALQRSIATKSERKKLAVF